MKEYIVPFVDDVDMEKFESLHGTNGELIRCKDCKYQRKVWHNDKRYKEGGYFFCGCSESGDYSYLGADEDFCSYGERKEDG